MKVDFYSSRSDLDKNGVEYAKIAESCLDSGIFVLGDHVKKFEKEFSSFCGVSYCISVGNGLDALSIALRAYGISTGDEVIVPAHTFVATWLAVSNVGAIPVPVDVKRDTYNIDFDKIKTSISNKTKAIIAVHLYGLPAEMELLRDFCDHRGIFLLEDAAQAHGASIQGRRTGSLGHAAAFSFYPTKNLGAFGDGGAICTNDPNIAEKALLIRNYGSKERYLHEVAGINSRLDEMQAAFLCSKLSRLEDYNKLRINAADSYSKLLEGDDHITIPDKFENYKHVYHLYVVQIENRDKVQKMLLMDGIKTLVHYPTPPYLQAAYKNSYVDNFEISTKLSNKILSLPIFPGITEDEIRYVSERLKFHVHNCRIYK